MIAAGPSGTGIVVATHPVDFRKQHMGLAAIVQNELGLDPYSGAAVVFLCKRRDLKVLWWDGTGLVLAHKRLEKGRFASPSIHDGTMHLSRARFEALFETRQNKISARLLVGLFSFRATPRRRSSSMMLACRSSMPYPFGYTVIAPADKHRD